MADQRIVKEMYLFFDYLYETPEQIGEDTLSDWSHKEKPKKVYCEISVDDKDEKELSTQWANVYDTLEEAEAAVKEWNEF